MEKTIVILRLMGIGLDMEDHKLLEEQKDLPMEIHQLGHLVKVGVEIHIIMLEEEEDGMVEDLVLLMLVLEEDHHI
tara:strand:+ start:312 stop:539 length:228 start_codon:yes stop_codon:yes gene_type:complete